MSQIVAFVGYALAICAGTSLVYFWQRAKTLQTVIKDAASRLDVARKQVFYLEENLAKAADKTEKFRENTQKLEEAFDESRDKLASVQKQFESQETSYNAELNRLQLRLEHQNEQVRVMTEQLIYNDRTRRETVQAHEKLLTETESRVQRMEADLQQKYRDQESERFRDLKDQLRRGEGEIGRLKHELLTLKTNQQPAITAEEVQDAKRRAAHYEKLYYGMKSLREMSDDRSRNWETALRQLSIFVLENSAKIAGIPTTSKREISPNMPLGPLIGEALEVAGGRLVDDSEGGIDMEAIAQKVLSEPMGL